jgi:serine/threonine protein kinase
MRHYKNEVEVLLKLKHRNIAQVLHVFEDCMNYLYVTNIDQTQIESVKAIIKDEESIKPHIESIFSALVYMHKVRVTHSHLQLEHLYKLQGFWKEI